MRYLYLGTNSADQYLVPILNSPTAPFSPPLSPLTSRSLFLHQFSWIFLQLSMRVECRFVKDVLNGDDATEMRVFLREMLADTAGKEYREE